MKVYVQVVSVGSNEGATLNGIPTYLFRHLSLQSV